MSLDSYLDKLVDIEQKKELHDMQINDVDIWPYVKNKIFGILTKKENTNRSNRTSFTSSRKTIDRKKQAHNISQYDVLVFDFYRFEFDENYDVYDSRNNNLIEELNKQNISYAQIVPYHENDKVLNIYQNTNTYILDEMYLRHSYHYNNEKISKNYKSEEINQIINETFDINFNIDIYEQEFIKNIDIYHSYIQEILLKSKPKAIFINANVVRPYLVIEAKKLGILVYDVQYAAILPYHLGYDLHGNYYKYAPDGLFVWGDYWKCNDFFSKTIKDIQVIGYDRNKSITCDIEVKDKSVLIVSQDLFSDKFIESALEFCETFPDWTVYYKKHPAEKIDNIIESNQLPNLIFETRNISELKYVYSFVVGINSTALFEMANIGNKIIILNDIASNYMKSLIDSNKALLVDSIVDNFDDILEYNYYNVPEFFEHNSNIDFSIILNNNFEFNNDDKSISYLKKKFENNLEFITKENKKKKNLMIIDDVTNEISKIDDFILTIVIPCYNVEDKLERLMASLKRQQIFSKSKIVMINDGSSDNTLNVLNEIASKESNIKIISNDIPSGNPSKPRNIGIDNTDTKYIFFLDSDDFLYGNTLDFAICKLIEKDVDFIKTGCLIDKSGHVGVISSSFKETKNISKLLKTNIFVYTHIFKTDIIKKNNIRFIQKSYEDLPFIVTVYAYCNTAVSLDAYMTVYQKEEGTESDVNSVKKFKDLVDQRINTKNIIKDLKSTTALKLYYNLWVDKFILESINYVSFFNEMKNEEKEVYEKRFYEMIEGIEKYNKKYKGINRLNILDILKKNRDEIPFKVGNPKISKQKLILNTYRESIFPKEYFFNEIELHNKNNVIKINLMDFEDSTFIIANNQGSNLNILLDNEYEMVHENIKYEIKTSDNILYINKHENNDNFFIIENVEYINKEILAHIEYSGTAVEFDLNKYYYNEKKINKSDIIVIGKNKKIKITDAKNNVVPIATYKDKYMLQYVHIKINIDNNIGKVKVNKRIVKNCLKIIIRKFDKKNIIINYIRKR